MNLETPKRHVISRRSSSPISRPGSRPGSREAATIICYGQTGTGKTHTFNACWKRLGADLAGRSIAVTFFEIHGKKCFCGSICSKGGFSIGTFDYWRVCSLV
jgi:Cdc6-like AAA superfamily ATPase